MSGAAEWEGRPGGEGLLAVRLAVIAPVPLVAALAVLGALGSYATIERVAEPYFGRLAPIVPVGMDVGVLALLAWDLLLEHFDLAWPVLRWIAWSYIAGTVVVNVSAADGRVAGMVLHAAMPMLFIAVMEGVRHLIRTRAGLAGGRRIETIPFARWLLAPCSTALLWRRMVLWHVTTYRQGLALEYERQRQIARLQETYGRLAWRWRASAAERLSLRPHGAQASIWEQRIDAAEDEEGRMPDWAHPDLVAAAGRIAAEAERDGVRLTRLALADGLRKQGYAIANGCSSFSGTWRAGRLGFGGAGLGDKSVLPPQIDVGVDAFPQAVGV